MVRDLFFHVLGLMPTSSLLLRATFRLRNLVEPAGTSAATTRRSAER
jgi:hypothetical protein